MAVPISYFLFVYLLFIGFFIFYTFMNLYHILKFGFVSLWAYVITFAYIGTSILALFVSYFFIAQVDWSVILYYINQGLPNL